MSIAVWSSPAGTVERVDWSAHTPRAQAEGAAINPPGASLARSEPLWRLRLVGGRVTVDATARAPVVVEVVEVPRAALDALRLAAPLSDRRAFDGVAGYTTITTE